MPAHPIFAVMMAAALLLLLSMIALSQTQRNTGIITTSAPAKRGSNKPYQIAAGRLIIHERAHNARHDVNCE